MDIERQFEDLGVDAVTGVELMRLLNINPDDFLDPSRFMRFKDIIGYFKDIPDKNYLINKVTIGKPVDKLDHVWGYIELSKQKNSLRSTIEEKMERIDKLNQLGDDTTSEIVRGLNNNLLDLKGECKKIDEQMYAYER